MTQLVKVRVRSDSLRVLVSGALTHCCSLFFHRDLIPLERREQLSGPFQMMGRVEIRDRLCFLVKDVKNVS